MLWFPSHTGTFTRHISSTRKVCEPVSGLTRGVLHRGGCRFSASEINKAKAGQRAGSLASMPALPLSALASLGIAGCRCPGHGGTLGKTNPPLSYNPDVAETRASSGSYSRSHLSPSAANQDNIA
ncbi:hypothetical protein MN608_04444 [Microdochium nivale]|nr:hypothetical protein MN608_04444 [Microdochium nivale]